MKGSVGGKGDSLPMTGGTLHGWIETILDFFSDMFLL